MFLIANTFAICFNKDYLLTYLLTYIAVCSAALGASAPTEGGAERGHIVAAARLQLVTYIILTAKRFSVKLQIKCTSVV